MAFLPLAIVLLGTLVRLGVAAALPLFPDETYYWEWSRRLAAGYFDHPPAIAMLIRAGTLVLGDTPLGVRLGAVLSGAVAAWALVTLATRLMDPSVSEDLAGASLQETPMQGVQGAAVRGAVLAICIPIALAGFVLATPDAPLLAAVSVMLVALDRAIAAPARSSEALRWWCAAGVMLGVAFCAKYTAVLVPFGVFVAMLVHPRLRGRLAEPGPYVAAFLAIALFVPVIVWNAEHGWVSFAFQINHGLGTPKGSPVTRELNLIAGQLGLVSPILGVMLGIAVGRTLRGGHQAPGSTRQDRRFVLAIVAMVVFAFFVVSAIRKPVEANWPAPALVAALPLLAAWYPVLPAERGRPSGRFSRWFTSRRTGSFSSWFTGGTVFAAVCGLVLIAQALLRIFPIPPRRDPVSKAYGWDDLAARVGRVQAAVPQQRCPKVWIAADRYQDASELAFYLSGHPTVFSFNLGGRFNQYDLWPSLDALARPSDCILLVVDDTPKGTSIVQRYTRDVVPRDADLGVVLMTRHDTPVDRRHLWLVAAPQP